MASDKKQRSLSSLMFGTVATILVAGVLVMGAVQMLLSMRYFNIERKQHLTDINQFVTVQAMELLLPTDTPDSIDDLQINEAMAAQLEKRISIVSGSTSDILTIADTSGRVVLCSNRSILKDEQNTILSQNVLNDLDQAGVSFALGDMGGAWSDKYYTAGNVMRGREYQPVGYILVSSGEDGLYSYMVDSLSTFVLSAGLMLLLASLISIVFTNRLALPLRHIADAARCFGRGDFSARAPKDSSCAEVEQLADTFNNMARNLQSIDSSRSQFMGNIAHELRTPMTSLKGFVDGMLDGTIPPELQPHYLGLVSDEAGRMTRLIQNMLDITKLEAGEYKVNAGRYDIWSTLMSVAFAYEKRIEDGKIDVQGLSANKLMVYADKDLVHQVVSNLVDNALKFTPEGGVIRFEAERDEKEKMVKVCVYNTGQGISQDALPFVFDRFYKEDKSRSLNIKGSGLGLHICKVLVSLSGGRIWVESEEGKWCRFCFTLPSEPPRKK